eukprot:GHUV01036006.1.p1 GENE.GHUV01036006.1~~GHUV01036006.1.p1  ORF type:complete len:116 (-),score=23.17 GHUV01036006.1:91-438(-)
MIRAGFTDAALDQEARELVAASERMRAADYGTEAVLLLAVQAEVESLTATNKSLRATNEQLQDQVQQLQDRLVQAQGSVSCRGMSHKPKLTSKVFFGFHSGQHSCSMLHLTVMVA